MHKIHKRNSGVKYESSNRNVFDCNCHTLGCILFASFISSNNQVSNARDFYNVAVNRIEDSNCNDQVISQCKSEAGEKGYTLEIEDLTIYNEQPSRLVILKYSITMPVFSLFGNGLSKQGVIEGYAR